MSALPLPDEPAQPAAVPPTDPVLPSDAVPSDAVPPSDDLAASAHSRTGWRAVTTRGRLTIAVAVAAAVLGGITDWREWSGIAAALAVLLVAAGAMALGRSSAAV